MAIAPIITHGSRSVDLPDRRIRRRHDDLDEITQTFQRATSGAFAVDGTFPGASGFVIRDVTEIDEVTASGHECYVYELRGVGLGPQARILDRDETPVEDGFDTGMIRWLTSNKFIANLGNTMPGAGSMFCREVKRAQHPASSAYWYVTAQYVGLLAPKPPKIRWTQNGREVSKENLVVPLPGGWGTPRKGEVLWPRAGCTISYVTKNLPAVQVPFQATSIPHPQAPFVFTPFIAAPVEELLWHWPNGWTLAGIEADVVPGRTMAYVTENWVYNHPVTLG